MEQLVGEQTRRPLVFHPGDEEPEWKSVIGSNYAGFGYWTIEQVVRASADPEEGPGQKQMRLKAIAAAISGIAPRDEIEAMLAAQMVAAHNAALECLRTARTYKRIDFRQIQMNQANKLMRTFVKLRDTLDRHRGKGKQQIRVEHVHVNEGGQAIVGVVNRAGERASQAEAEASPRRRLERPAEQPLRCANPQREAVPVIAGHGEEAL